ncbi:2-dehydro-3-deoxyphosphogluconate aldolase/(4S)-4-hydroxy-2-oxoglutarate aldolase [Flavobacterium cutihirudinis]|uniref:2-dehydro-3-deoxyphosphogluconate aldolase/(4S)-4-hydroxy-2-oxoglutarate aldolase n=1 Tax=Flavobacterium cutihirudinis TaxID=1265740 RepID=A0A3D9FSQ3_9FLAO|nr:bifunctional 4-hydroxy-2-oxoglutarate aldolase/2-dehydro-3-deoxy-phosphogluconate aldolase [Flavobacterium cutihirudinis]RED23652.1 2-dehydro-3-deoxyphosphogluconate aldolase/(4S)-4-hydroxy-2-oxoglutarate aldolase [Flavobacterium cutihirudinis]
MIILNPFEMQQHILQEKFIPLFTNTDVEVCKNIMRICYENGIRTFEFTDRNENSFSVFKELKAYRDVALPQLKIGIGTIKNAAQAELFIEAGADFLISPIILEEIHLLCQKKNILWIPGCATPSEIVFAEYWGLSLVKIFPAKQLGGDSYIEALKTVFPKMHLMATGGVEPTKSDIEKWYKAGVSSVGLGAKLFPKEMLLNQDYDKMSSHLATLISDLN